MSTWIDKDDCLAAIEYYKEFCEDSSEACSKAADSLGISPDRMMEIIGE